MKPSRAPIEEKKKTPPPIEVKRNPEEERLWRLLDAGTTKPRSAFGVTLAQSVRSKWESVTR